MHSARFLPVEAFKQGNCCAAQTSQLQEKRRFLRRSVVLHANFSGHVYLTPPYDVACHLASLGASVWRKLDAFRWLRQALVHIQTRNAFGRRPRPSSMHTQPFRSVRVLRAFIWAWVQEIQVLSSIFSTHQEGADIKH